MNVNRILILPLGCLLFFVVIFSNTLPTPVRAADDIEIVLPGQRIKESAVAVADFNKDGKKEIVAGGIDGMLYVINGATYTLMWSKQIANYFKGASSTYFYSSITIADLNKDGRLEIIAAVGGTPNLHLVGGVVVLTYVGGSAQFALASGWPRRAFDELGAGGGSYPDGVSDGFESTPAVGDLDGDKDLEIVISGSDRRLHAWHHNGKRVAGWPIDRTRGLFRGGMSSPALADIDQDGLPEVLVGSHSYPVPGCPNPYFFLALNGNGSLVPGFPTQTSEVIRSSPAIGDINGDGRLDIVVGTGDWAESCGGIPDGKKIYAWDHRGRLLPGWPTVTKGNMASSPALGDLDGDGDLEVVVGCGLSYELNNPPCTELYAWHGDGRNVTGFPMSPLSVNPGSRPPYNAQPFPPVLADYDGDGIIEIMTIGAGARGISIVEPNGQMSSDVRHTTPQILHSSPLVDDIDGDNLLETVIGGANIANNAAIYIWQETGTIYSRRPWPMFHHDVARTGLYSAPPPVPQLGFPTEVRFLHQEGTNSPESLTITLRNLGIDQFNWQVTSSTPDLQINPGSGTVSTAATLQLVLNTTPYPATNSWQFIGNLTVSGRAFGQHVVSSPRTVPVWLYHGQLQHYYLPLVRK